MDSVVWCPPFDVTFEANTLKTLWDTGDGGEKSVPRKKRKKVTKSVQGDFASKRREVVSHIVFSPTLDPTPKPTN